ncbi:MAG: nuclear transport factor 2 family protein [Planctomycetota bacterium]
MTTSTPTRAMRAVMSKDREAWLDCFTPDAVLRDPVGGSALDPDGTGLVGREALAGFWDAVVAPAASVAFEVREEHVSGRSVARVATVEIGRSEGEPLRYDGVFVYDLDEGDRIQKLCGYFELPE